MLSTRLSVCFIGPGSQSAQKTASRKDSEGLVGLGLVGVGAYLDSVGEHRV
jgi:hypothetical protein